MGIARLSDQRGFTLIELMVTMVLVLGGMAATAAMVVGANTTTSGTKAREAGTGLAREVVEASRAVQYSRLVQNTVAGDLQAQNGLTDSRPNDAGWQIERRGTLFTVTAATCAVDDPRDGIGEHPAGAFCSDPAPTSPPDSAPDDYKRVVSTVTWKPQGRPERSVRQTAIVTNPTNNSGPRIVSVTRAPVADPVTIDETPAIAFTATTSPQADAVKWTVDGVVKHTDAPSSTTSDYSWPINSGGTYVVDGTYVVSATAYDSRGQAGATRSVTVKLDRGRPVAVDGLTGGWNARVLKAELEWRSNPESDVVKYRVYRKALEGSPQLVCETPPTQTECIDDKPLQSDSTTIDYYAVALDQDVSSGELREGTPSPLKTVTVTTNQPSRPAELSVTSTADGPQLSWTEAPAPLAPYEGQETLFYRIYRDGQLLTDRIDRTGGPAQRTFTDTTAGAGSHSYWVTTVDTRYSESVPLGPVGP